VLAAFGYQALAPLFQLFSANNTLASIALRALVLLSALLLIALSIGRARRWSVYLPMFILMGALTLRLAENYFIRDLDVYLSADRMFLFWVGGAVIPAVALALNAQVIDQRKFFLFVMSICVLFVCAVALQRNSLSLTETGRASFENLNPISLGFISLTFAIMFAIRFLWARNLLLRICYAGAFISMLALIALAQSRGPVIAGVLAIITYAILASRRHRFRFLGALIIFLAGLAASYLFTDIDFLGLITSRMSEVLANSGDATTSSVAARTIAWDATIQQIKERPMLGDVIFERALNFYPHQMFLEAMMSVGLVGTVFLVLHLLAVIRSTITILSQRRLSEVDVFCVLACWSAIYAAQFSGSIYIASPFWPLSAALIARGCQIEDINRQWLRNRSSAIGAGQLSEQTVRRL